MASANRDDNLADYSAFTAQERMDGFCNDTQADLHSCDGHRCEPIFGIAGRDKGGTKMAPPMFEPSQNAQAADWHYFGKLLEPSCQ
jgi:hypothetical protein